MAMEDRGKSSASQPATPAAAFDSLASLPFRHELLGQLSRVETAVLSAIIYAARLRDWGEEFPLSDYQISRQTGYSTRHIRRARASLLKRDLFSCRRKHRHGVNYYSMDRAQVERILRMSDRTYAERIDRVIEKFPDELQDYARVFYLSTGRVPRRSWMSSFWLIRRAGKSPTWLRRLVEYMQDKGYMPTSPQFAIRFALKGRRKRINRAKFKEVFRSNAPLKRFSYKETKARKKAVEELYAKRYYRYAYDPFSGGYYVVETLPLGATEDIFEEPFFVNGGQDEQERNNTNGRA